MPASDDLAGYLDGSCSQHLLLHAQAQRETEYSHTMRLITSGRNRYLAYEIGSSAALDDVLRRDFMPAILAVSVESIQNALVLDGQAVLVEVNALLLGAVQSRQVQCVLRELRPDQMLDAMVPDWPVAVST